MNIGLYLFSFSLVLIRAQVPPNVPADVLPPKKYAEPYKEQNLCAYLKPNIQSVPYSLWTCGAPFQQNYCGVEITVEYHCCPGYMKNKMLDSQCGESLSVWKLLPNHLADYSVPKFSDLIKQNAQLPDISNDTGIHTYTVFAPHTDSAMKNGDYDLAAASGSPHPIGMHIAKSRIYSDGLKNDMTIQTLYNDHKLKITTYSNGLIFIDCRALVNPDHDAKNGVIHYISGPLTPHVGSGYQRKTVLQTLQNDPQTNSFYNDIPADMRTLLDQDSDYQWFTVFAPQNDAWNEAKSKYNDNLPLLVKNHILNRMICAQAITTKINSLGPTNAGQYLGVDCSSNGARSILDACGKEAKITKEDLVSGNGVVQIIDRVLVPSSIMEAKEAISCISQSNPDSTSSKYQKQSESCDLQMDKNTNYLMLVPTDEAFKWLEEQSREQNDQMQSNDDYKCQVFRYHILKMKNPVLSLVNQVPFDTNLDYQGKTLKVTPYFVKYRDGSKLFFNRAQTTKLKSDKFKNGHIYFIDEVLKPPTKTIMEHLNDRKDVSVLTTKIKETGYDSELKSYGENILLLAWQNHGWETRKEKKWEGSQLTRLFQLHTLKLKLWGGNGGYIDWQTYSDVESVYMDGGSPFPLKIKRELNGNTYIGYEGLSFNLWSLVIERNLHATDGMVWIIDWPLRFKD